MIGTKKNRKVNVDVNVTNSSTSGSGGSGLTAAEKQQLEKIDVLEKELGDMKTKISNGTGGGSLPNLPVPTCQYVFNSECAINFPVVDNNTFYNSFEISVAAFSKTVAWTDKSKPLYVRVGSSIYNIIIRGVTSNGFVSEQIHLQAYPYNEISKIDETEYNRIKNTP